MKGHPVTPGRGLQEAWTCEADTKILEAPGDPRRREPANRAGFPLKKERCRKNAMSAEQSQGKDKKQTRALLPRSPLGARPRAPRYLGGRRRAAALLCAAGPSGARTMRRFQTWLLSRSRRAGAGAGGKEGKSRLAPSSGYPAHLGRRGHASGEGRPSSGGGGRAPGKEGTGGPGGLPGAPGLAKDVRGRSQSQLSSH